MQSDRLGDVIKLFAADIFQLFPLGGQLFVDLDDLLGHYLVGFLRTAHQGKIVPRGHPFVTIGIKADAQKERFAAGFFIFGTGHVAIVRPVGDPVKVPMT